MIGREATAIGVALLSAALVALGVLLQRSAASTMGIEFHSIQLKWVPVAIVAFLATRYLSYPFLLRQAYLLYAAGLGLLAAVPFFAPEILGSRRWLSVGGMTLQPSEPMKLIFILVCTRLIRYQRDWSHPKAMLIPGAVLSLPVILIFLQPDLGSALLFLPVALGMFYVAGAERRHLAVILIAGLAVGSLVYAFFLEPYQRERVLSTVLRHRLTPVERQLEGFQLEQSLRAIGNGGAVGRGLGQGEQNLLNRLPHRHNDFIFAVHAEEMGFLGSLLLLGGLFGLLVLILKVGLHTREPGGRLICVGVGIMVFSQSLVHLGVNVGLVPTTGMTLPFVSYGGSSLVTFMALVGLVANVSRHRLPEFAGDSEREQLDWLRARG